MVFGLKAKLIVGLVAVAGIAFGGWQARAWYEDSQDLAAAEERQEVLNELRKVVSSVAERVENKLSETQVKERVIDRGIIRETQKTVYRDRECFEPELVRLLNLGAEGGSADISGELTEKVPGDASETE